MHIAVVIISVADKGVATLSGITRTAVVDGASGVQLSLDDIHPLGGAVVAALAQGDVLVVAEIVLQRAGHHHGRGATASLLVFHLYSHAEVGCQLCHSVALGDGEYAVALVVSQHVVPVIGGLAEVGREFYTLHGAGLLACSAGGIFVVAHNLRSCRSHTACVVVHGLASIAIGGTHVVEGCVLTPAYVVEQRIHHHFGAGACRGVGSQRVVVPVGFHVARVEFHPRAQACRCAVEGEAAAVGIGYDIGKAVLARDDDKALVIAGIEHVVGLYLLGTRLCHSHVAQHSLGRGVGALCDEAACHLLCLGLGDGIGHHVAHGHCYEQEKNG